MPALIIWAVIPIAKGTPVIADVNIGFLWILAVAGIESYGIILAGWSSNNNYSLLGALRSAAQMVSYELPLGLFLVSIIILADSSAWSTWSRASAPGGSGSGCGWPSLLLYLYSGRDQPQPL